MNPKVILAFKKYFEELDLSNSSKLEEIYSEDICFKDPIHEILGLNNLKSYFKKLNSNLIQGKFYFTEEHIINDRAYLSWEMELHLKRPKKKITASGISILIFKDKVISHRDYFDAGELFYEHVPIIGGLVKFLKKQI